MMHILDVIIEKKRKSLQAKKAATPIERLMETAQAKRNDAPSFNAALLSKNFALIAETKRSSPSQGTIVGGDYDAVSIARRYEAMGAAAISVLTEEAHFHGSINDLSNVAENTKLPCLCKDFIFDEYQVYEAKAAGAAAILLICRLFDNKPPASDAMSQLHDLASSLNLGVLVETHNEQEVEQALEIGAKIIGVNSRDLDTLQINMRLLEDLVGKIPADRIVVAESGLSSIDDLQYVRSMGARAALIGTALLKGDTAAEEMLNYFRSSE